MIVWGWSKAANVAAICLMLETRKCQSPPLIEQIYAIRSWNTHYPKFASVILVGYFLDENFKLVEKIFAVSCVSRIV